MVQTTHSFIDIAVLDGVREPFLRGDALALLSEDLGEVLWANGPGAALLRLGDIEAARNAPANIAYAARVQIAAVPGFPRMAGEHSVAAKLSRGSPIGVMVSSIALPSGGNAVLLRVPAPAWAGVDAPARAISGIAEAGHFAALLDGDGHVLAASGGFAGLGVEAAELAALARDVADESDRLAKRLVRASAGLYPAGIARLADAPARHMVIIVDDPQPVEDEVEEAPEPIEPQSAAAMVVAGAAPPPRSDDYDSWYFIDQAPALTPAQDASVGAPMPSFEAAEAEAAADDLPVPASDEAPASGDAATHAPEAPASEQPQESATILDLFAAQETSDPRVAEDDDDHGVVSEEAFEPVHHDASQVDAAEAPAAFSDEPVVQAEKTEDEAPAPATGTTDSAPAATADSETTPAEAGDSGARGADDVTAPPASPAFTPNLAASPVRFVWRTDAQGRFSNLSSEFARAVGPAAADIVGQPFREVARRFGLDPDGEIAGLLDRRDTWSGRTVMWPLEGAGLRVPVDLAALPVYARDRSFEGFRGFGVVRMDEAVAASDPAAPNLPTVAEPQAESDQPTAHSDEAEKQEQEQEQPAAPQVGADPFRGEAPAISVNEGTPHRRDADKVIRLAEHRPAVPERQLSSGERLAFAEIGARLREAQERAAAQSATRSSGANTAETGAEATISSRPAERSAGEATGDASGEPQAAEPEPATAASSEQTTGAVVAEEKPKIAASDAAEAETGTDDRVPGDAPSASAETALEAHASTQKPSTPAEAPQPEADAAPADPDAAPPHTAAAPREAPAAAPEVHEFIPSAFSRAPATGPGVDTSILERLPVPVLIHSGDTLHYANEEFLSLTGYESVEQLEYSGGLGALFAEGSQEGAEPVADHRRRLRTRTGQEFPVEALLQSVPWHRGKALLLALRPAAPAAPAAELTELEARVAEMRAILDTATDGIVMLARDGTIRSISRPAEALFGFDNETVAGKPFVSLFAVESQRAARDYLAGLSDHGVASVLNDGREVIGREAMGRFIPLFMTIGRLPGDSGYCAVLRDITQWKRAEDELTRARSEAERASSQKTEFLARISHEIRTPLNAIIGFSELMLDEKFGPIVNERYRDYLRDINRSGNHVLDLVNDLLDISKIEAGEQELSYEAVSLNEALAEAVAMMQPQANRDRVIIRSSYASKLPEVVADLRSVRQIALNLLSNAVRFTQAGGQVIVSTAYEVSGDVVMRVRDTGIGMSQGEIEQALKPFKQINALKRPRGDGTGLGLPLTKAMVEANRARFSISSAPGEGTLVEIVFPSTRVLAG